MALGIGCGGEERRIHGELGYQTSTATSYSLGPAGDTLYLNYGPTAYSFDVTNPRKPKTNTADAYAGVACGTECVGILWNGSFAYFMDDNELALVPLPEAGGPAWLFEFPDSNPYFTEDLARLPGGNVAVSRSLDDLPGGDILLLDMSGGFPSVASRLVNTSSETFGYASSASGAVVVTAAERTDGTHSILAYDASDITNPFEISRSSIDLPPEFFPYVVGLRGLDLVVTGLEFGGWGVHWIGWYRFSPGYGSLVKMGSSTAMYGMIGNLAFHDRFLFVAASNDQGRGTRILSLDTSAGLSEHDFIPSRGFSVPIAVDSERGLVYVGGDDLQILDLGVVTTGEPRWP